MARLERGKGARKQVVEILQLGTVLQMQETVAGDRRLPGYRRFADEIAARAALDAEVRARLGDGMQPADDAARTVAGALPPRTASAALPLRRDLAIYNEATGFVITSRRMAGKTLEEGSSAWAKAVSRGDMLPLTLVQDDSFIIRVVVGEALTDQEQEEWVARVDSLLNVADGELCVTGGSVFTNDDYDADDPAHEQFVGSVTVPKGKYQASLYSFVHGVNGRAVLDHLAGGHHKAEPLDDWFARTRPDQRRPDWDDQEFVDFLLHLEPIDAARKRDRSPLADDGWFSGAENARKPERCPLGLAATDVVRPRTDTVGGWIYVRDVFPDMPRLDLQPVTGGPVPLALNALAHAGRLAWFGSRFTTVELRLTPAPGGTLDFGGQWPDGFIGVTSDGIGRVLFDADLDVNAILGRLHEAAARLLAQPDGTTLELGCRPVEKIPGTADGAGLLQLRGEIRQGVWQIGHAWPATDAHALSAAIALAAEIQHGASIAVRDEAEAHDILAWARRNFGRYLSDNPPKVSDGAIRFKQPGHEVALVGIAAFAIRFSGTWPVVDLGAEN